MSASIFWYDFETTGINPRCDRPMQVAGIRTDEALNEIDEPINLYCRLSDDILPHPAACLVTAITPAHLESGLVEGEFITRLHQEMSRPGTCTAGFNSLRFDDELTRHTLYRNFFDPYAREWQGGNSRWDLIDAMRTAYALRPEGFEWPVEEGRVTLRLERLTAVNGIDHGQAHDALADVRATIAMARLLRSRQPRLYTYLYQLRSKHQVLEQIRLLKPVLHVSGRYAADRHFLAPVLPLAWHPRNRNALIVCDLAADPAPLLQLDAEQLAERLYTKRDELPADTLPVPLKLVHINKCPVVAPLNVLRDQDKERLQWQQHRYEAHAQLLIDNQALWQPKLAKLYEGESFAPMTDPEQQLYDGFIGDRDRRLCEQVRHSAPEELAVLSSAFADARLPELLFRYRARNFPSSLSESERQRWSRFCKARLHDPAQGAPNTLEAFEKALEEHRTTASVAQQAVLSAWGDYAQRVRQRYNS